MAAIMQHVPRFDGGEPKSATFASVDEPLAIPWIARFREPWWEEDEPVSSYCFSLDCPYLMAEYNKGASWINLGTLAGAQALLTSLPRWVRPVEHGKS